MRMPLPNLMKEGRGSEVPIIEEVSQELILLSFSLLSLPDALFSKRNHSLSLLPFLRCSSLHLALARPTFPPRSHHTLSALPFCISVRLIAL